MATNAGVVVRTENKVHRSDFPDDFIFGTSTSAYQIEGAAAEGGRGPSIWDTFTLKNPAHIDRGANGNVAIDAYHRYKEDVQLLKKLGLDAYRFSISWSRVLPGGKLSMGVNREGVNYYNALIDELLANGIEPYVTLFHWDLPQALEDEYMGFLDSKIVDDFIDFAEVCFWEFGDKVKNWITLNEPYSYSIGGYAMGTFAPGRGGKVEPAEGTKLLHICHSPENPRCTKGNPSTEPYIVTHNLIVAHAAAVDLYRQRFQAAQKGKIGITLMTQWYEPLDPKSKSDQDAAQRALNSNFGWYMEPLVSGDYPQSMRKLVGSRLPQFSKEQAKLVKGSFDFLGLNYFTGRYATNNHNPTSGPPSFFTDPQVTYSSQRDGKPIGELAASSWLNVYPEGFYKLLMRIKEKYNSPLIYITENGVNELNDDSTKTVSEQRVDQKRIDYHHDHLVYLSKAINEGVNVKGYFVWSFLDNFEWGDGYKVRFGMIHIDYKNQLARYPKSSALWFKDFLAKRNPKSSSKKRSSDEVEVEAVTKSFKKPKN